MTQILIPLLVASIALNVYFYIKSRRDVEFLLKTALAAVNGNATIKRNVPKRLNGTYINIKYLALQNQRMKHNRELVKSKLDEIEAVLR